MNEQNILNLETAIFANGCFWCTEAIFQRLHGVHTVVPGYIGGHVTNPSYQEVRSGRTGHAEGIKIGFDPDVITFQELLEVFFATHDPTTLNRQGNDVGTQYRSEVFYTNEVQKGIATRFIVTLGEQNVFSAPIVTAVSEAGPFYLAEDDHQNYYNDHKLQPYCQIVIDPKVKKLKTLFPGKLSTTK